MKFKLDENLGRRGQQILAVAGHDVTTVSERAYPSDLRYGFTGTRGAGKIHLMKFATVLDRDEDGMWIAERPSIPGCVSQGKTRDEAFANIKEAIALCLEVRAERGMPLTIETQQSI